MAGQLVLGSAAGIVMNTAVVLPAILLGRAIDTALAVERGAAPAGAIAWAALAYVGGVLLTEGPRMLKRWWLMTANARIRANLRADALRGVLDWPTERLHRTPVGDLMARIVGDVEVLGVGVREFTIEMWDTVLFSISLVVAMLLVDVELTLWALAPVPLAMLLAHAAGRWVARRTTAAREANAELTAALQEQLGGLRLLRLFGRAEAAVERSDALSDRLAGANLGVARLRGLLQPVYTSLMVGGVVVLVWQGSERVLAGGLTVGAFVAYLELYLRFANRGFRVPQLVNSIQSGGAAYARLRPLLAPALAVAGEPRWGSFRPWLIAGLGRAAAPPPAPPHGPVGVTLERVSFRYPDAARPALRDLSLEIPAGGLVAVTGAVGSGKSALARALAGIFPLAGGRILLGGRDLAALPPAERATLIGYLPQDGFLFSGTVAENVLLDWRAAGPAEPDLTAATELAGLGPDLERFPAGLATEIGELGLRVSGGQRQRISLARALLGPARLGRALLVLDDPFSAVDVETEARIVGGLRQAFGPSAPPGRRATVVLCSHRLASFPLADLVVVLDGGRIAELGPHAELLRAGGLYARIFEAQRRVEGAAGPTGRVG